MKTKSDKQREVQAQALGMQVIFIILALVGALFMGLFSKNKFIRILSAVCLVAIGIGVASYYMDESPAESSKDSPTSVSRIEGEKYNWSQKCIEHWGPVFEVVQEAFAEFGGFKLAQLPVEGADIGERSEWQHDVPLKTPYRYFNKADLYFLHGALVEYKLTANFDTSYSKASIEREYEAVKSAVSQKLKLLASSNSQIEYAEERRGNSYSDYGITISYGKWAKVILDFRLTIIPALPAQFMTLEINAKPGLYDYIFNEAKRMKDEEGAELPAL